MKHLKTFESTNGPLNRLRLMGDYYKDKPELVKKELDSMRANYGKYMTDLDQTIKDKELELTNLKDRREKMKSDFFEVLKKYKDYFKRNEKDIDI